MQASFEHYLKTIYILHSELEFVKQSDIVKFMNHSRPSVCRAVHLLKENGFISIDGKFNITLTEKGELSAKKVVERYKFFKDFLMSVGINETNAENDACNLEHALSGDSFEQLKLFVLNNRRSLV